jgi:hypothetical protein
MACLMLLASAVPAIAPLVAEARAGGSYGGSHSYSSHSSFSGSGHSFGGYHAGHSGAGDSDEDVDSSAGGLLALLLMGGAIFGAIYLLDGFASAVGEGGSRQTPTELLPIIAEKDPAWEEANMLAQAREVYMAVQNAWVKRNQDLAKDVMTEALYDRHQRETDAMTARGEVNLLTRLEIIGMRVLHVADYLDNARDEVWIKITARAIDCLINEHSGMVLKGSKDEVAVFSDIWKFRRQGDAWLADAIAPGDGHAPHSFSEALGTSAP